MNSSGQPLNLDEILAKKDVQKCVNDLIETVHSHIVFGGTFKQSGASEGTSLSNLCVETMKNLMELSVLDQQCCLDRQRLCVSTKNAVRNSIGKRLLECTDVQKIRVEAPSIHSLSPLASRFSDQGHRSRISSASIPDFFVKSGDVSDSDISSDFDSENPARDASAPSGVRLFGQTEDGIYSDSTTDSENPAAEEFVSALITRLKKVTKGPGEELNLRDFTSKIVHGVSAHYYSHVQLGPDKLEKFVIKVTKEIVRIYGTGEMLTAAMKEHEKFTENIVVCLKFQLAVRAHAKPRKNVFQRMWTYLKRRCNRIK